MTSKMCKTVNARFDAYRRGELPRDEADSFFAHVMLCEACRIRHWEPEVTRFRSSLMGGALLIDQAVSHKFRRWGSVPQALAASVAGERGRVGFARGVALLGDDRDRRVDVFCHATLVGGSPGSMRVQLPPALKVSGLANPFRAVEDALYDLLPKGIPPMAVEVALDAPGPLPSHLVLAGDSLHLPVAIAAASAWLGLPIRSDRIFTGALRSDGLLLEVGDLGEKLYLMPQGAKLVLPARNTPPPMWRERVLVARDLAQAVNLGSAILPGGRPLSIATEGISPETAAARATLEEMEEDGIILSFPMNNPTGAPLWYLGSRGGLVAFIPGGRAEAEAALSAVRGAAEHLRAEGALSKDSLPFPLRGFSLGAPGQTADVDTILGTDRWMDPNRLYQTLSQAGQGRGFLPFATALTLARTLFAWGGGASSVFESALPKEASILSTGPVLKVGKIRQPLGQGAGISLRGRPPRWSDPDLGVALSELTRHLFVAGSESDGAGTFARVVAEAATRDRIPTVVLDLAGGMTSLAIPATTEGLEAVAARLPGSESWLSPRVQARDPWPGEQPGDIDPVSVRVTFAAGGQTPLGAPPEEGLRPELWVIDVSRQPASTQGQLLKTWCNTLRQGSNRTVHPGRPNALFVICPGERLGPKGSADLRSAVMALLKAGPQVGVSVLLRVRSPGDLHPELAALCGAGLIGSPGAMGSWANLPPGWAAQAEAVASLKAEEMLYRSPDRISIVLPRFPASLPLPNAPMELLERFATKVEGQPGESAVLGTVIPDQEEPSPGVVESGLLLPKIPFTKHMAGYRVPLGKRGEVGGDISYALGYIVVRRVGRGYEVSIEARDEGIYLDGRLLRPGEALSLAERHNLRVDSRALTYTYTAKRTFPKRWPYVAEIEGVADQSWPIGDEAGRMGRDRSRCDVWLPDRKTQGDILWVGGQQQTPHGAEGITLDAIHASGLHGEIILEQDGTATLHNRSSRIPLYLRRGGDIQAVDAGGRLENLKEGDEILVGQRVFRWDPLGE